MLKIVDVKETLANSLIELSYTKPIKKITIKDIVDNCNTGRQTFYNHFSDKFDLINWIYKKNAEKVLAIFKENKNWYECLRLVYCVFVKEKQFFTKIVDLDEFVDFFYKHTRNYYIDSIISRFGKEELTDELLYSIEFNSYGEVHMCIKWIKEGMKRSPEEMAKNNIANIPPTLMKYFI
ncbi:MAG: TetR/AcrR family transcriptional regulator C-terminal domain-containing protein [Caldicoprobacterales bacterium]